MSTGGQRLEMEMGCGDSRDGEKRDWGRIGVETRGMWRDWRWKEQG